MISRLNILAVLFALILAYYGYATYQTVNEKAEAQSRSVQQLTRWKAEYTSLLPYRTQWDKQIPPASMVNDIYSLHKILALDSYGLQADATKITVTKIEAISISEIPIATTRVCLATAGYPGIRVTAPFIYPDFITALEALAKRRDIEIASLTITTVDGVASAILPICLRIRE